MPDSDATEVAKLAEYGYDVACSLVRIVISAGFIFAIASYLIVHLMARRKVRDETILNILKTAQEQLFSFAKNNKILWVMLLIIPVVYVADWSFWLNLSEMQQEYWFYQPKLHTGMIYALCSGIWLSRFYDQRSASKSTPGIEKRSEMKVIVFAMIAVGFNKIEPLFYNCFFLFYPFVAIRSSLCLAYLFQTDRSVLSAANCSLIKSRGHFWELARLFSSTGFLALLTTIGIRLFNNLLDVGIPAGSLTYALVQASSDTLCTFLWIYLDCIILSRGLEYVEMRSEVHAD